MNPVENVSRKLSTGFIDAAKEYSGVVISLTTVTAAILSGLAYMLFLRDTSIMARLELGSSVCKSSKIPGRGKVANLGWGRESKCAECEPCCLLSDSAQPAVHRVSPAGTSIASTLCCASEQRHRESSSGVRGTEPTQTCVGGRR